MWGLTAGKSDHSAIFRGFVHTTVEHVVADHERGAAAVEGLQPGVDADLSQVVQSRVLKVGCSK